MEQPLAEIERVVRKITGARRVTPTMRVFHDLSIAGDDAWELLEKVGQRFGTSFEDFQFEDYFPEEGMEALLAHFLRLVGMGRRWKPLTVQHLADVAVRASWFEPAPQVR